MRWHYSSDLLYTVSLTCHACMRQVGTAKEFTRMVDGITRD